MIQIEEQSRTTWLIAKIHLRNSVIRQKQCCFDSKYSVQSAKLNSNKSPAGLIRVQQIFQNLNRGNLVNGGWRLLDQLNKELKGSQLLANNLIIFICYERSSPPAGYFKRVSVHTFCWWSAAIIWKWFTWIVVKTRTAFPLSIDLIS